MNSDQNSGPLKKSTDRRLVVLVVVLMLIIGLLLGWVLGSGSYKSDDDLMNATEDSGLVEQTGQSTTTTQAPATTTAPPLTTTQAPATTTAPSPTTTQAPVTTTAPPPPPAPTQAEAAGCSADAGPLPENIVLNMGFQSDLDGVAGEEVAYTYFNQDLGKWVLRAEAVDGSFSSEWLIQDSDMVFATDVLGVVDTNADGLPELMVKVGGGAYTQSIGFAVVRDCEVEPTRNLEGGVWTWAVGASVQNIGGFECTNGYVRFESASLTEALVWLVHSYKNSLNGIVWESTGTAGSNYVGETEDEIPPFESGYVCPTLPSMMVDVG